MTATFGKLEHKTLTLEPGLNVIEAPNEWGKTTWCAFLAAMLYGLDTRAKSTKTALADKERYAPWSGSPMAGRMDLNWNGRDITIERKTKGRVPLGQFSAYETESGLPVPELTAANCGQMLLGVERSVFLRAGFIRAGDLPVTQDEALRARLNALVTTGDESGDAERLGKALKDLKNRCRYNRSGLLPQAEAERAELENKLRELESLEYQCGKLAQRQDQIREWAEALENHKHHLEYQAAQTDSDRVAQAEAASRGARERLAGLEVRCAGLPSRGEAENQLLRLRKLQQSALDLQMEERMMPQAPQPPEAPPVFRGMSGPEAIDRAKADGQAYGALNKMKPLLTILGIVAIAAGCGAAFWMPIPGVLCALAGAGLLVYALIRRNGQKNAAHQLAVRYGSEDPAKWLAQAEDWAAALGAYEAACSRHQSGRQAMEHRVRELRQQISELTAGRTMEAAASQWEQALKAWDALGEARREAVRAEEYCRTLAGLVKPVEKPQTEDELTYSNTETARLLSDAGAELSQLRSRLSQYQGRMEALGDREAMHSTLEKVTARIAKLEDTYAALAIAQQTLTEASLELQRRFAPKISQRAQALMTAFTAGRYDRLTLDEDLGLRAGAAREDTLHDALWRSEGTVDQMYLALRLAVAEALTEQAPLILDDALIRFDDTRLKAAMEVLQEESQKKQVILFTCQSREKALIQL